MGKITEEFCSTCFSRPATNRARCRRCFIFDALKMSGAVLFALIIGVIGWRFAHPMLGVPIFLIFSGWSVAWFWTRGNKND